MAATFGTMGGGQFEGRAASRPQVMRELVRLDPSTSFWYMHHPARWTYLSGEWVPWLSKLSADPGVANVDQGGDTAAAERAYSGMLSNEDTEVLGRKGLMAAALKRDLGKVAVHGRAGDTGARPGKQIGFHAIRGGDIVGEHTVIFAGTGERVEVTIRSQSRMTYALGALRAALFAQRLRREAAADCRGAGESGMYGVGHAEHRRQSRGDRFGEAPALA